MNIFARPPGQAAHSIDSVISFKKFSFILFVNFRESHRLRSFVFLCLNCISHAGDRSVAIIIISERSLVKSIL